MANISSNSLAQRLAQKLHQVVANHYLDCFEKMFLYTYFLQPFMYVRYIDDCFLMWHHGLDELHSFVEHLNSQEPTTCIKFTVEVSGKEIPFLDVKVKKVEDRIVTDLVTKTTDSHDYLLFSSAHPHRCKNSIPYSQFLRIKRICSEIKDFDKHVEEAAIMAKRKIRAELLGANNEGGEKKLMKTGCFSLTLFILVITQLGKLFTKPGTSWEGAHILNSYMREN